MSESSWRVEESTYEERPSSGPTPVLVTLHFIRSALRRRWRFWVGAGCIGMLLGVAWTFGVPAKSTGTVTILLAHDPAKEPSQAMATDMSLLRTRTVATAVVRQLDLKMQPDVFQQTVSMDPVSTDVLVIQVSGPDPTAAKLRAKTLSAAYLRFRTEQLRAQSAALIDGYTKRVDSLQRQSDQLTNQYESLAGPAEQSQAADVLAQRSQVNEEITGIQQSIQDASLKTQSIITASHVVDPASVVPQSLKKRAVLAMGSGLIVGTAMGVGLVLFTALTSERLRRRDEVAAALGVPVRLSVKSFGGRQRRRAARGSAAARDVQVLAHGLDSAISPQKKTSRSKGRTPRLALASVDNADAATQVVALLGAQLAHRGVRVFLVDLSEAGGLEEGLTAALKSMTGDVDPEHKPVVFRPEGVPSLSRGPAGLGAGLGADQPVTDARRSAWDRADAVLVLADLDPAVGADHIRSWADEVVLLVTAGRSSAERVRTSAELVRSADLGMPFAMMVGADPTDESVGLPEALEPEWAATRRTS
jgi:uncharacterized protein involved in exopolysaccharide biosynthesis